MLSDPASDGSQRFAMGRGRVAKIGAAAFPSAGSLRIGRNWVEPFREEKLVAKKPPPNLTVIGTEPGRNRLSPPPGLGEAGRKLWNDIHHDFFVDDAGGLEMLAQICGAADRVAEYAAAIARDGPVIRT